MAIGGLILLIGVLVLAITLLMLAIKVRVDDGGTLQVLLLIFSILLFILVPKLGLDYQNHCELKVVSETVIGNVTTFSHDYVCVENEKTSATTFYNIVLKLTYILIFYAFMYGLYKLYKYIKSKTKW